MNISKKLSILALSAILMVGQTACGGGSSNVSSAGVQTSSTAGAGSSSSDKSAATGDKVTVTFWNGWSGPDGELLTQLVDQFNEKNTDNVFVDMDIMEFASLNEKLATSLASNTNPNLHLGFAVGEYTVEKQYIPISDIFDKTGLSKDDFDPMILDQCYYKGELYGLPFQVTSHYLFWNKDLFEKAGLDPNTPPKTWDELNAFSAKIDTLGGNIQGGGFRYNYYALIPSIMTSFGGKIVVADDKGVRSVLTDPEYIDKNRAALQYILDFTKQSTNNTTNDNYEATYQAGTCAMYITGAWQLAGAKDNNINYGVSLMPAGPVGITQSGSPISMCVMKNTEGAVLDGAYKFMEYWNNNIDNPFVDECPAFKWSEKQGYQPYLRSMATDERLISDPDFKIMSTYIDHLVLPYDSEFYNGYAAGTSIIQPMCDNVVFELMSIDDALKTAHDELTDMISKMKFN